jgi:hypothetical protein
MDGKLLGTGNVKLGIAGGHGTFSSRKPLNAADFETHKSLVIQIEKMQIETVGWKVCPGSDNCQQGMHFHFLSPN